MSITIVTKENYEHEVLNSTKTVLLDFYADWCGPCRLLSKAIDEIAAEYPEYKVCKVNVDDQQELAAEFQVMTIPSLFVIKGGKVVNQSVGVKPKAQILNMLG